MKAKDWQRILIPYQQAVDELLLKFNHLKDQRAQLGETSPIESVTGRVKSLSSILEKINKYHYRVDDVEEKIRDIAGIRIICQFVEDIYEVADMIYSRNNKDLTVYQVKNYLLGEDRSAFHSGEGKPKESGYQSYHIIVKYPVFSSVGYREIFVEIQIRTLAMNFWAVVEHSLNYKYKAKLPEVIKKRLTKTANTVQSLDTEMSTIRDEILSAQKLFRMKSSTVNDIVENIETLRRLQRPELADEYNSEFNRISVQEDLIQLILLKREIESEVGHIKEMK
ncbi:MAG: GTP pyrophosphokinase family protein [Eubacteriaceae bacterium]|jgi:putative GTP pyrophosphokinase|uniref:GTP pyrophosphokinase family protein n=1 Tax=Candidatus Pseudoramibacter fermentans TaxID=2594427 RepID=A0A6L5GS13_9FIRM|nr:GTP pyrophosphokinase family protein [Candidatus Pseudoramibacter fermentans]RRF93699.1 MAG: GTP pyrophosphokinase family protein [Eubacteriaceae bacterium]